MAWVIVVIAVVMAGLAWLAAQGRLGGMPPLVDDRPGPDLPDSQITADDLRGVRFAVTSRGYSMAQVDALIDRLANQLDGVAYEPSDELDAWLQDGAPAQRPAEADEVEADGPAGSDVRPSHLLDAPPEDDAAVDDAGTDLVAPPAAPVVEEPALVVEEPTPVVVEPAREAEEPAPVVGELAPVVGELAPVIGEPAPVIDRSPAPDSHVDVPDFPAADLAAPAVAVPEDLASDGPVPEAEPPAAPVRRRSGAAKRGATSQDSLPSDGGAPHRPASRDVTEHTKPK